MDRSSAPLITVKFILDRQGTVPVLGTTYRLEVSAPRAYDRMLFLLRDKDRFSTPVDLAQRLLVDEFAHSDRIPLAFELSYFMKEDGVEGEISDASTNNLIHRDQIEAYHNRSSS